MVDEEAEAEVPDEVRARLSVRKKGLVKVLRVLCALPALLLLYQALFPKLTYTSQVSLAAPGEKPGAPIEVRLELRDRALALVTTAGAPKVVARNNVKSATIYRRLLEVQRSARVLLVLAPPAGAKEPALALDSWQLEITTTSDYGKQVGHRLWGLLLGLLLVGLAALLIPRLIGVLWPER